MAHPDGSQQVTLKPVPKKTFRHVFYSYPSSTCLTLLVLQTSEVYLEFKSSTLSPKNHMHMLLNGFAKNVFEEM